MATDWNRLYLKNWLKSYRGLQRLEEDGLLTDDLIHEAIETAIRYFSQDCDVLKSLDTLSLIANQYAYNIDELYNILAVLHKDSDGTYYSLKHITEKDFFVNRDVVDDTSEDPLYYAYPIYDNETSPFSPQIYFGPTPNTSDAAGSPSILIIKTSVGTIPDNDLAEIPVPRKYERALKDCLIWQAAELTGIYVDEPDKLLMLREIYQQKMIQYQGDEYKLPKEDIITVMGNRRGRPTWWVKDMTYSGNKWTLKA